MPVETSEIRLRAGSVTLVGALALVGACAQKPTQVIDEPTWVSTPAPSDVGASCADVHSARACWGASAGAVVLVARPVPAKGDAWRCVGQRDARACRRRKGTSGPFACGDGGCVQDHPRMPDDGEWECFERGGAVVCHGGEPAAGVVAGRRDEAWICGERRGAPGRTRVCVDLAPDRPDDGSFSHCTVQQRAAGARQVCGPTKEPSLGGACEADLGCPAGAACVSRVCLPARAPLGECWQDTDCGAGEVCVFATCAKRP